MHAFAVFTKKYLRPCDYSMANFMAAVNYTNPTTEKLFQPLDHYSIYFNLKAH